MGTRRDHTTAGALGSLPALYPRQPRSTAEMWENRLSLYSPPYNMSSVPQPTPTKATTTMSTTITFERNATMSAAHLSHEDGGNAYVFCSIPAGRPWLAMTRDGQPISITNAPQCDTHRQFVTFVSARFAS